MRADWAVIYFIWQFILKKLNTFERKERKQNMEKVENKSVFSIIIQLKKGKTLFGSKLKFFWLASERSGFGCVCVCIVKKDGTKSLQIFFIIYPYFTERCHFKSDSQNLSLKIWKIKIFFPRENFSFLEMKHLTDICAGGERLTFINLTLAR